MLSENRIKTRYIDNRAEIERLQNDEISTLFETRNKHLLLAVALEKDRIYKDILEIKVNNS